MSESVKSETKQLFTFKVYPEHFGDDNPIEAIKKCLFGYDFVISPLHDHDKIDGCSDYKKPHYHINIKFVSRITQNSAIKRLITAFEPYGGDVVGNFSYIGDSSSDSSVQPARGSQECLDRYLCHIGYDDKAPYSTSDIVVCGGYQLKLNDKNDDDVLSRLLELIFSQYFPSIGYLVSYCQRNNYFDYIKYISKHAYFITQILKGNLS